MAPLELTHHCDALVFGQELLFGSVRLTPDLDLQCRVGSEIADPLGVGPPGRKDDRLARVRVVRQRHSDRLPPPAGLPALVGDQQECVVEQTAPAVVVQGPRHPHGRECETSRMTAQPEQRPPGARASVSGRNHDFVSGGLKIRDSYAWVTAATCCETCATTEPTGFAVANAGIEIRTLPVSGRLSPSSRYCG